MHPTSALRHLKPLGALLFGTSLLVATAPQAKPKATPKPAKQVAQEPGKNLKVFKGQGLDEEALDGAMDYMGAALGVNCAHCHVRDEAKQAMVWDRDDKPAKQVARKMVLMTRALNKAHFKGEEVITCASCHNGHVKPETIPPLPVPGAARPVPTPASGQAKPLPTVDALLAQWAQGAGGREALAKVTTRTAKGSMDLGGGRTQTLEVLHKAPGMMLSTLSSPRGSFKQAFDGTAGWNARNGKANPMDPQQVAQARFDADLALPLHFKDHFPTLTVAGRDQMEGREVIALAAKRADGTAATFYFDAETGLLARRLSYSSTPLGRLAHETSWQDYRAVDGVMVPFKVIARGPHSASITTYSEITTGAPVDDAVFRMPKP
ncbi:MAG TPA: c-type cytochrome [Holophagaceae bacterium]|nr:c-type cytochrome [Holophagaceae bacterium]